MNFGVTGQGGSERRVVESGKVLLRGAGRGFLDLFRLPLMACNRPLFVGVGRNQAGVDRKPVGADQALGNATLHHALEKPGATRRSREKRPCLFS